MANDISTNKTKVQTEAWVGLLVLGFLFLLAKAKRRLDNLGLRTDLSLAHGRKACNLEPLSRAQLAEESERINNFKLQTTSVRQVVFVCERQFLHAALARTPNVSLFSL